MRLLRTLLAAGAFAMIGGAAHAETAVLRGLDKVTGHARDFNAPVGRTVQFGSLEITARRCAKRPAEEAPEVTVFVEVSDAGPTREGEAAERRQIFSGWMFASSPGLSALQHPVYDIWAVDCRA